MARELEKRKNVEELAYIAKQLQDFVDKRDLSVNIAGKRYVLLEGWQFVASLTQLTPIVVRVQDLSTENVVKLPDGTEKKVKEIRWLAEVEVIDKNGNVVSRGFAIASSSESKRRGQDEYAILSMAQTRAISKALRNKFGWIMKLAGYEATPAEEAEAIRNELIEKRLLEKAVQTFIEKIRKETSEEKLQKWFDRLMKSEVWKKLELDEEKREMIINEVQKRLEEIRGERNE